MKKYQILRKKYPNFIFKSFYWKPLSKGLEIFFNFEIEPKIKFSPKILIENLKKTGIEKVGEKVLNNLVFHLGLIELLSYWKATCSPKIKILAGFLNKEQIEWWKDLILKGMGEYFFKNQINFLEKNFLEIETLKFPRGFENESFKGALNEKRILLPLGGGKDSLVSLEYLRKMKKELVLFCLNPKIPQKKIIKISKIKEKIFVKREIDKNLLKLNKKGFLNGHTPFTAYLSFLSVLLALFKNCKFIAFSSEKSSEEGNVKYLGKVINHQYSKTKDFEKKFKRYSKKYLAKNLEYFSLLRNFYESEILALFSQFPQYFNVFLSCNKAYKIGAKKFSWCQKCPKCLFTFVGLYPFIGEKVIKIFGKNLFNDKDLLPLMEQLIGERKFKPFECVGTKKENLLLFYLSWKSWKGKEKPFLLKHFGEKTLPKISKLGYNPLPKLAYIQPSS